MIRFNEAFPEQEIASTLSRQLSWLHFLEIIYIKDDLKRDFYAGMCRIERGVRARNVPKLAECSTSAQL